MPTTTTIKTCLARRKRLAQERLDAIGLSLPKDPKVAAGKVPLWAIAVACRQRQVLRLTLPPLRGVCVDIPPRPRPGSCSMS